MTSNELYFLSATGITADFVETTKEASAKYQQAVNALGIRLKQPQTPDQYHQAFIDGFNAAAKEFLDAIEGKLPLLEAATTILTVVDYGALNPSTQSIQNFRAQMNAPISFFEIRLEANTELEKEAPAITNIPPLTRAFERALECLKKQKTLMNR